MAPNSVTQSMTAQNAFAGVRANDGADGDWHDFVTLLKPKVMTLVVFTGAAGMIVAPGTLHPVLALTAMLCIAVGSGAAGAINMWYDRDIDAIMRRTRSRPIPKGRVEPESALAYGVLLSGISVFIMGIAANWMAAALLAGAIAFYVLIYTVWLKRRTPQNIVIGGAAGAFPPLIGWAAVTGDVSIAPLLLFAIIFAWTPPHFWALALYQRGDYAAAGVPMLPVTAGAETTKRQMLAYTIALLPITVAPVFFGVGGVFYLAGALTLGVLFIICAVRVLSERVRGDNQPAARKMFGFSIFYLFALFALLIIDPGPLASWGIGQ